MSENPALSESEKCIFAAIDKSDIHLLKTLLVDKQDVNIFDDNSMTPLQHAAYKGNKDMVQMLLDQGADVNICQHQHGYTALHFAGLSGNADVCSLLLLAGAKSHVINSVGRTPSQMAAFVGNHNCVSIINNFIPKSDVECYTTIQGQQTQPALPPFLSESFHKFATQINVNPVRVALTLQRIAGLMDHLEEVAKVLELMCTKEMKRGPETNEVMAFKFHHLGSVVTEVIKLHKNQVGSKKDEPQDKKVDTIELFARKLLKTSKDGNLEFMDAFLRESVRNFPFRECTIFRQMVTSLAGNDPPSAISVVASAINGQRGFIDSVPMCNTCGEEKPSKKCSKCKVVQYCDRECQRLHWFVHKKACARLSQGVSHPGVIKPDPREITADMQNLLVNN